MHCDLVALLAPAPAPALATAPAPARSIKKFGVRSRLIFPRHWTKNSEKNLDFEIFDPISLIDFSVENDFDDANEMKSIKLCF